MKKEKMHLNYIIFINDNIYIIQCNYMKIVLTDFIKTKQN